MQDSRQFVMSRTPAMYQHNPSPMHHTAGGVRELLRISSRQTLMPCLTEESEENSTESANISHDQIANGRRQQTQPLSFIPEHTETSKYLQKNNNKTVSENGIPQQAINYGINRSCESVQISPATDMADRLRISNVFGNTNLQTMNGDYPMNGMDSSQLSQTNNHLLGVPDYYLSNTSTTAASGSGSEGGAAPDLTQSDQSRENSEQKSSPPDLLRVENNGGDKTQNADKMAPLSDQGQVDTNSEDEAINLNTFSRSRAATDPGETDTGSSSTNHPQHKIFGRFSSADELNVKEANGAELESKFVLLKSGFDTEKQTLDKRLELSHHGRTSAEESLKNEINAILESVRSLIVRDASGEMKEDLRKLEERFQMTVPLSMKLASKAEHEGAIKQEKKLVMSSESMVAYVQHLRHVNVQESTDHQATRLRLLKAQEWGIGEPGDNSVNVNITRRSSTIGGHTQTLVGRRRASVALTALPNILGSTGMKQLSMLHKSQSSANLFGHSKVVKAFRVRNGHVDPRSKFQHMVRKTSLTNCFRRSSQESNCSDYTELPAVTVSSPNNTQPSTPVVGLSPRPSFSGGALAPTEEPNNNQTVHTATMVDSSVAVIKTISAVMPSVEMIEKPEEGKARTPIRRRRSIKRSDTIQRHSVTECSLKIHHRLPKRTVWKKVTEYLDHYLDEYDRYRRLKERWVSLDKKYPTVRRQSHYLSLIILLFLLYLQFNTQLTSHTATSVT